MTSQQISQLAIATLTAILTGYFIPDQAHAQPAPNPPETQPQITRQRGYAGIGGVIGLNGKTTAWGTGGFSLFSKTIFTDNLSMHNASVIFGSSVSSSSSALTLDFPIRNPASKQIVVSPFLGGGVMMRNENGLKISPQVTGGVDVPVSKNITGTVQLNVGFPSERQADMGLLLGLGYNF
jgi:hypothetical protein